MNKRLRTLSLSLALLCVVSAVQAQDGLVWKLLSESRIALENNDYGESLALCEKARDAHRSDIEARMEILKTAFSPAEVRRAGDSLSDIYPVLEKRNDLPALSALDEIYLKYPPSFFKNSSSSLLEWLGKKKVLPEADMLEGEIYEAEGESALALSWYLKAWENRAFFDIPDERFDLLYRMSDLSLATGKAAESEKYLLLVLSEDSLFGTPERESPALAAMKRTLLQERSLEKFFLLYRHEARFTLKAYQDLTALYRKALPPGSDRTLSTAVFSSIVAVSWIDSALRQADISHVYTDFDTLLKNTGRLSPVSSMAARFQLWKSFLTLAEVLLEANQRDQARDLLTSLSAHCPDREISLKAIALLSRL